MIITGARFGAAETIKIFSAIVASGRCPAKADIADFLILYGTIKHQPRLPREVLGAMARLLRPPKGRGAKYPETTVAKFLGELKAIDHARELVNDGETVQRSWDIAAKKYGLAVGAKSLEALSAKIKKGQVHIPNLVLSQFKSLRRSP